MRFEKLQDWLAWQESLHPQEIELGLDRVRRVWERLETKVFTPVVVTVAGTNGKGSCSAMLESIYRAAGYRVGCYSSPHLLKYNERIKVLGSAIDDIALCEAFEAVDQAREEISLTYFEFGTLAALTLFANADLDIVILEVGLGGRLDAVNIIDADVALLTSVGLDHQDWLGDDREKIGREKAGVFRRDRPAICAEQNPPESVLAHAREIQARCLLRGQDYSLTVEKTCWSWLGPDHSSRHSLPMPALRGSKQVDNAAAVVMAIECLANRLPVSQSHLRQGLLDVRLPGRFQIIPGRIPVILDVAHNPQAAEVLSHNLREFECRGRVLAVLGMKQDKDAAAVANYLQSQVSEWYLGSVDTPLGLSADRLANGLRALGVTDLHIEGRITSAFDKAMQAAMEGDCILVFGSFYTVADILNHLSLSV